MFLPSRPELKMEIVEASLNSTTDIETSGQHTIAFTVYISENERLPGDQTPVLVLETASGNSSTNSIVVVRGDS